MHHTRLFLEELLLKLVNISFSVLILMSIDSNNIDCYDISISGNGAASDNDKFGNYLRYGLTSMISSGDLL